MAQPCIQHAIGLEQHLDRKAWVAILESDVPFDHLPVSLWLGGELGGEACGKLSRSPQFACLREDPARKESNVRDFAVLQRLLRGSDRRSHASSRQMRVR